MKFREHLLISLEERHAKNILSGDKQVELRRRTMHVNDGDVVWLYVKKPVGAIMGFAIVGGRDSASPTTIWRKFGHVSGLAKSEFMGYFGGTIAAFALGLNSPKALKQSISLDDLRGASPAFHPPQFYQRLSADSAMLRLLINKAGSSSLNAPRAKKIER